MLLKLNNSCRRLFYLKMHKTSSHTRNINLMRAHVNSVLYYEVQLNVMASMCKHRTEVFTQRFE